jgi:hypothetical protein
MWWLTGPLDGSHHKRLEDYSIVVTGLSNIPEGFSADECHLCRPVFTVCYGVWESV